jgi:hypothetical protein
MVILASGGVGPCRWVNRKPPFPSNVWMQVCALGIRQMELCVGWSLWARGSDLDWDGHCSVTSRIEIRHALTPTYFPLLLRTTTTLTGLQRNAREREQFLVSSKFTSNSSMDQLLNGTRSQAITSRLMCKLYFVVTGHYFNMRFIFFCLSFSFLLKYSPTASVV